MRKRQRAFNTLFAAVTLCGALAFWRYVKTPQIEVAEKPLANAKVKAELAPEIVQALESSDKVMIYSLMPHQIADLTAARNLVSDFLPSLPVVNELFHGYVVLGKTEFNGTHRNAAVTAIFDGINASNSPKLCFSPRHGLRVKHRGKQFDLVICFHCEQTLISTGEKTESKKWIDVSKMSQPVFDALLKDAGITLSPE